MLRSRRVLACAAVAAASLTAIPISDAARGRGGGELTVTTREFAIGLSRPTVPHGVPIAVTVVNHGTMVHEAIPELVNVNDHALRYKGRSQAIEGIAPGKSKSGTWLFAEPGVYKIACHVMDHNARGMHILVTVT